MSIIAGTDLSDGGAEAITAAAAIAIATSDHELTLAHVVGAADLPDGDAGRERVLAEVRSRLEADAARLAAGTPLQVRIEVVVGPAVDSLIGLAETEGARLIVVAATATRGGLLRLGSTAEALIARAPVPVLAVRDASAIRAWAAGDRPLRALVGIDESATADVAIQVIKELRAQRPIDVTLGTVYYADVACQHYGLPTTTMVDAHPEVERLLARDLLRRFGTGAGAGAVLARPVRGLGRIGDHLVQLADRENADVIVLGTHHRQGLGRLGSVSAVVANQARQAVLCVPPGYDAVTAQLPPLRVVVVATDRSAFANRAIPYGYAMAGSAGDVHLVTVIDRDDAPRRPELESELRARVPRGTGANTTVHVLTGEEPAEVISELAARVGADAVCIASRGRTGLSRALLGSVADELLKTTRVPVLILCPKE